MYINQNNASSAKGAEYQLDRNLENFFINGFKNLEIKESEASNQLFKTCEKLNDNILKEGYKWEEKYFKTEDLLPNPYLYDNIFLNFLFDQNFNKQVNELTGLDLILGDFAIRRAYPSKKSYVRWHRDTHFYKGKQISGRMPPIYKLILYIPNDISTKQLYISPGSHHRFIKNRHLDIAQAVLRKKYLVRSSKKNCIFLNSMLQHSVTQNNLNDNKPSVRLFYNFCVKSQTKYFPGRESLHKIYEELQKKNF